jgi:hypothetical protein
VKKGRDAQRTAAGFRLKHPDPKVIQKIDVTPFFVRPQMRADMKVPTERAAPIGAAKKRP